MAVKNITPINRFRPTENDKRFMADVRRILAGNGDREPFTCTNRHLDAARALLTAFQEEGRSGFERSYESLARDNKHLAELRKSIEVPAEPGEQEEDTRFTQSKNGKKVIVRLTEDDIDQLPDIEYLIDGMLQTAAVSMLYGPSGTSKTFNALHIAYCIAHGINWLGHSVKPGLVWFINTEGGHGLKPRLQAWRKEYERSKTRNIEFITWPVHLRDHRRELLDTISEAEQKPALLIIDNYSMCATGTNQNDQMEVTQTLGVLHEIAHTYGCHCLIVHHSNWTGKVNGSAAFKNHVDTMLDLSRASKDSPIVMKCEKQRDTAPFDDLRLDLKVIPLYVDPNTLKTITSCVVIPSDAPIKPGLSDTQQVALDLLEDGMTFAEWHKAVNAECSVVKRTLERWRDDFIHKGLINKIEMQGKHPTYTRSSGISSSSEVDYE